MPTHQRNSESREAATLADEVLNTWPASEADLSRHLIAGDDQGLLLATIILLALVPRYLFGRLQGRTGWKAFAYAGAYVGGDPGLN